MPETQSNVRSRALLSGGTSSGRIYARVAEVLAERGIRGDTVVDVGCGRAALAEYVLPSFGRYIGVDVVRHEGLPDTVEFVAANVDEGVPLPDEYADAVVAVETIEHLENPRRLVREMARLARPCGWILITTPNQLSALSLATLLVRSRFSAFQDVNYPAHITALLESDLLRIASECALTEPRITYTLQGRIPGSARSWPRRISAVAPRRFSDNVILTARKPGAG